jgi:hypothetical protein
VSSAVIAVEPTAPPSARGEWWVLDRLALAWSVQSALVLYALIGRGGWYVDDFLNFATAKQHRLDLHYLNMPIFGHPQQATRLLNWLLYRVSPMNYALASALLCLGIGFMTWLVYRILRMAFQPSPWHLVLTAMVSTTAMWVPSLAWWAAGGEITGSVVASMLVVHAMLRCHRGPWRPLWGALAGGWLLVGLLFYERTLLGGMFAAWFLPAVTCRSARPRELLAVLRRAWSGYLALCLVATGYLLYYISHQFLPRQPGYTHADLLRFFWQCWNQTLIPGLFGGPLRTEHSDVLSFAAPQLWWQITCQLALLALIGYGVTRSRLRGVLAWLVFLAIFLPAQYAIATARLTAHQAHAGHEFRYLVDLMPLLVLTLGIAILRPAAVPPSERAEPATGQARHGTPARAWPSADRRQLLALGAALVALGTVYLVTAIPPARLWVHSRHVSYVQNLRTGVAEQDRRGPWSLYTTYVPWNVVPSGFGHYSQTPAVARLVTDRQVSADDLTRPMFVVTEDGSIRPARLAAEATAPATCRAKPGKSLLPLNRALPDGLWNLQLSYRVSTPTTLRFAIEPVPGRAVEATGTFRGFPVSGAGRLTFPLRQTAIGALRLDTFAAGVCVSDVQVGTPVPSS